MEQMQVGDASYFESYQDLEIHQLMLNDLTRNKAYKKAIFENRELFDGKVVLDVGTGTGILAVFCAQAGARKVYAVEASETYKIAEEIVRENGFENCIQVIKSRIEEANLPEQVDVIVSEWMGFYLLHEAMLDSVLFARDKFLKPNGHLFPESACLYSAPCSIPSLFDNWEDVEGVSMKSFASKLRENASKKPITIVVHPDHIIADPEVVAWLDLKEITTKDLDNLNMRHVAVANRPGKYQGICLWFSCTFPSTNFEPVILSTEPGSEETHWKQTVIVLPEEILIEEEKRPIAYELDLKKSQGDCRKYQIQFTMLDEETVEHPEYCTCYMTKCILARAVLDKFCAGNAEEIK